MTSYAINVISHPQFRTTHHFMYEVRSTVSDLTSSVPLSSHAPYRWYQSHCINDLISSISVTSHSLYLWHNIHYVWHHNTLCWWRNTGHMYDIFCTANDIAPTLSHQTRLSTMSHPLRAWQHSPSIRHLTHCIYVFTPTPLSYHLLLCDIIPTFCVTSYELYITSHPILVSSQYCTYEITDSIYENTTSMRATYTLTCDITATIWFITPTV